MTKTDLDDRITDHWNQAVDLGRKQKPKAMLDAWRRVRRFDDEHRILDDRERARMHLFLGNAFWLNNELQEACDEYAASAAAFLRHEQVDAPAIEWIEATYEQWRATIEQAENRSQPLSVDEKLLAKFREIVPSCRALREVKGNYKVTVTATHGHWWVRYEQGPKSWDFEGRTLDEAIKKAKRKAPATLAASNWGPGVEVHAPFPG